MGLYKSKWSVPHPFSAVPATSWVASSPVNMLVPLAASFGVLLPLMLLHVHTASGNVAHRDAVNAGDGLVRREAEACTSVEADARAPCLRGALEIDKDECLRRGCCVAPDGTCFHNPARGPTVVADSLRFGTWRATLNQTAFP